MQPTAKAVGKKVKQGTSPGGAKENAAARYFRAGRTAEGGSPHMSRDGAGESRFLALLGMTTLSMEAAD
jgi:hypothetical protein